MKNVSPAFMATLAKARDLGLEPVHFVWFQALARDTGLPVEIGYWTWDEDVSVSVISGTTGLPVSRTYYGALNLEVSDIPYVSDLTIQTVTVSFGQIAAAAQQVVREYDLRLAKCEIHAMAVDPDTGVLASAPELVFLGEVNGAPINTPAVGQDGSIELSIRSDAISMLARKNSRKSSYEGQKLRSGDEWGKYSSTVATWTVPWGKKAS